MLIPKEPGCEKSRQGSLDNINLFSLITIMSFFLLAPFTLLREGFKFTPGAMRGLGILAPETVIKQALLAGVCFHAYQQVLARAVGRSIAGWMLSQTR